ncbi:MAG: polysaccharide lyase family 7 protein [Bacteroidota bacterium]
MLLELKKYSPIRKIKCLNALLCARAFFQIGTLLMMLACSEQLAEEIELSDDPGVEDDTPEQAETTNNNPTIDFSNWKVTLPIPRPDGKPLEIEPPEILDYSTNPVLTPFMFNDATDSSVVFYTYPGSTTTNSSYSRTELREQMVPGSNNTNWTFAQGGKLRGTLAVPEVSTDENGNPHRIIIMQIHGRLTSAQRDIIGEDDNNAPPVLKIYWYNKRVYVRTKELKNLNVSEEEMLRTTAWRDDDGRFFTREVDTEKFTLEVTASEGRMTVTLDDEETFVYQNIHMEKWGIFENYFKAGNYLITTDEGAFSTVKYYELDISHE